MKDHPNVESSPLSRSMHDAPDALVAFRQDATKRAQLLKERAAQLARPAELAEIEALEANRQMIRFRAGESYYGLDLSQLCEIRKVESIATVPCTPRYLLGLIQVHGDVTPVIDLVEFFNFRRTEALPQPTTVLVIEATRDRIGLAVDELEEVHHLNERQLKSVPLILGVTEQESASGVMGDGTVVLDAEALSRHPRLSVGTKR